mmetsp:Transcript_21139/g.54027  ORF Transcript_21139/g.54027 Transcript_21139/m.54027 type:complete len:230 (+) Transcript_21139:1027-1716(+)
MKFSAPRSEAGNSSVLRRAAAAPRRAVVTEKSCSGGSLRGATGCGCASTSCSAGAATAGGAPALALPCSGLPASAAGASVRRSMAALRGGSVWDACLAERPLRPGERPESFLCGGFTRTGPPPQLPGTSGVLRPCGVRTPLRQSARRPSLLKAAGLAPFGGVSSGRSSERLGSTSRAFCGVRGPMLPGLSSDALRQGLKASRRPSTDSRDLGCGSQAQRTGAVGGAVPA